MTVIVGILCKDGVVVGTDSVATFSAGQQATIEQRTKKIDIIDGHVVVVGTGQVGLGQRFSAIVEKAWQAKVFTKASAIDCGKYLSSEGIKDFQSTHLKFNGHYGALVAFACQNKPCLIEFAPTDFQPEMKTPDMWYVSMGNAQGIADPFLGMARQVFWDDGLPTSKEATFVVTWILSQAIEMNAGGVNGPMQIAVLRAEAGKFSARMVEDAELEGHENNVDGLIEHMRKYRDLIRGQGVEKAPDVPKPEAASSLGKSEVALAKSSPESNSSPLGKATGPEF